jgi:hypothetical protein
VRSEIQAPIAVGDRCRIELEEPAILVYDSCTFPAMSGQGIGSAVLRTLARRARAEGKQLWVWSLRDRRGSLRSILKAGFQPRYRMQRTRLFGWTISSRVVPDSGSDLLGDEALRAFLVEPSAGGEGLVPAGAVGEVVGVEVD